MDELTLDESSRALLRQMIENYRRSIGVVAGGDRLYLATLLSIFEKELADLAAEVRAASATDLAVFGFESRGAPDEMSAAAMPAPSSVGAGREWPRHAGLPR